MIITLKEILEIAEKKDYAVGAFNTPNLECLTAVIQAAEKLEVPVIIAHAQLHEPIQPLSVIGPVMIQKSKEAKVPVCVHLDHGESLDYLQKALEIGFTSIMYDGSSLPYEENAENTRKAVAMAKKTGASVEAEIGVLGGRETSGTATADPTSMYTDPALAEKFVKETGIDALACSFGTAHGIYKTTPKLDFPRIAKIKELVQIPLVMHGGSGCSERDYISAIENGVRKINYYSYMSREGVFAVKEMLEKQEVTFFHDLAAAAQQAMQQDVERAMGIFNRL